MWIVFAVGQVEYLGLRFLIPPVLNKRECRMLSFQCECLIKCKFECGESSVDYHHYLQSGLL